MIPQYKAQLIRCEDTYYLSQNNRVQELNRTQVQQFLREFDYPAEFPDAPECDPATIEGEIVALIDAFGHLVIPNSSVLQDAFGDFVNFLTLQEYADKVGKKRNILARHCRDGRIPGAVQRGHDWYVPANAPYISNPKRRTPKTTD